MAIYFFGKSQRSLKQKQNSVFDPLLLVTLRGLPSTWEFPAVAVTVAAGMMVSAGAYICVTKYSAC
jgi:hypothetical protein